MKKIKLIRSVIELKKGKKYIFMFDEAKTGVDFKSASDLLKVLRKEGYKGVGVMLKDSSGLTVIEK